jgi:hypothetical protein
VAELVELEVVGVGYERFFVALKRAIALDACTRKLGAETEGDVVARLLADVVAIDDHRVGGLAHELEEIGLPECFRAELLGPEVDG